MDRFRISGQRLDNGLRTDALKKVADSPFVNQSTSLGIRTLIMGTHKYGSFHSKGPQSSV